MGKKKSFKSSVIIAAILMAALICMAMALNKTQKADGTGYEIQSALPETSGT